MKRVLHASASIFLNCYLICLFIPDVVAESYELPGQDDSVVGEMNKTRTSEQDTLLDIARAYGLGYNEIKTVNPNVDTWLPGADKEVVLPSRYVLPMGEHRGLILNIPEMRLYYFPEPVTGEKAKVLTYPLGIGRQGWHTPYISTRVIEKKKHPYWHPPESIREEHEAAGDPLPKRVEPGPDNPLGDYAMRLGLPDYLIHGTNKPFGIGMRVSHGCIRLYPEDIEELFPQVKLKTPVQIVNQPYKVGRLDGKIYLEAHQYLEEDSEQYRGNLTSVVKMIVKLTHEQEYRIEWDLAKQVIKEMSGIPIIIGRIVDAGNSETLAGVTDENGVEQGIDLQLETAIPD